MRSCEAVRAELKAYCDGELGFLTRARIHRHLARCAPCQTEVQALRRIGEELRHLDRQIVPSPELRARILQSLPEEPPVLVRAPSRSGLFTGLTLAGTTAVVALLAVIFYRMNLPGVTTQTADRAAVTPQTPALPEKSVAERPPERPRMVKVLPEEQLTVLHQKTARAEKHTEMATGAPPAKSQVNRPQRLPSSLPAGGEDGREASVQSSAGSGAQQFHSMAGDQTSADRRPNPPEPNVLPVPGKVPAISAVRPEDKAGQPGERNTLSAQKDERALPYKHPVEETIPLVVDDLDARLAEVEALVKAEDAFVGRARKSTNTGGVPTAFVVVLVPAERAPQLKQKLLALGMEEVPAKRFAPVAPQESQIATRRAQAAEKRGEAQHRDAGSAARSEPEVRQDAATPARKLVPDTERLRAGAPQTRQSPPLVQFVVCLQQAPRPAPAPAGMKK